MKRALIFSNPHNPSWVKYQKAAVKRFTELGWQATLSDDGGPLDVILVLGGDGTLLDSAGVARERNAPLFGINLGHLGFMAEGDVEDLDGAIARIDAGDYTVEERPTLSMRGQDADGKGWTEWALNEASIEKIDPLRMVELLLVIDGKAVMTFGCDGLMVATSTGSTGHAFSAGGPVLWPEVEALVVVPLAAHALFARPLVVAPTSKVAVTVRADSRSGGVVTGDSRRSRPLTAGCTVEITRSASPVRFVRFGQAPFADRLVRKFALPVKGWRDSTASQPHVD
ncbi:MAG: NAD kinase [Micrococcales bacterium]|nr:NAD kinase [Micrococcales bacterium]